MDRTAWESFLHRWNEELLATGVEPDSMLDKPVTDGWLGYSPASAEQVRAAEERLGCTLPPSLREFLLVTDGWQAAGAFGGEVRGAGELGWLRDLDPMWSEAYDDIDVFADEVAALRRGLMISEGADAGVLFLDPGDVDDKGEWAAYELFSWSGSGPERHGSFHELMYDLCAGFHTLDRPQCQTQREWDAKIEQARLAILSGEIDEPLAVLEEAQRFGRDRASVLSFQVKTVLGHADVGRLIDSPLSRGEGKKATWTLDAALLSAEMLPVLFAEHHRNDRYLHQSALDSLRQYGTEPVKQLIADYRARMGAPGFRMSYGPPEFDAAVRAIDPAGGDAWPRLREALALWRPLSEDHVAPACLMADPRIAPLITPDRGREILAMRRG
ncbi:SMI1/KNR4 family protein [Nonomuraea sp. LPB2021202275-12-8]|uniref:SMI1/KNR4 family protein n=1 Tax=Nonomuraea sp. LPB2021202275-12-8 TaxID=3120159 RepID=UPI00300C0E76